jgi:glycosyltransferase involved in cell wall biosynthesis
MTTLQLWRVLRSVRPDVVHLVTIKPILLGGLLARLVRVPALVVAVSGLGYVFMSHGSAAWVRRSLVSVLYKLALTHRNLKVIFQNADDLRSLNEIVHLPAHQVVTLRGSGVDLAHFAHWPLPAGVPVVVLAARLLADKGVFEFVEAAKLLKAQGCSARFVLVGTVDTGNPTSVKQTELDAWVRDGVVEWWGHRSDMAQVLSAAQIVVLPSYREGLPKVLLEAAACGRPVVTTNVPGCRDAIEPGVTGVLVPVQDALALAQAMNELILDPVRCERMGTAGRALAEQAFDVRQVIAAHLQIYAELIDHS